MKNLRLLLLIQLIVSILTVLGCSEQKHIERENIQNFYSSDNALHPEYKVFHIHDTTTIVYYQFNFADFAYKREAVILAFKARYMLKYELYNDFTAKKIIDSASVVFVDSLNYKKDNSSLGYFELNIPRGKEYILRLKLTDLNAEKSVVNIININKKKGLNRQNFYLQASDGLPVMHSYVEKNQDYQLVYNDLSVKKLYVKYFTNFHKPPKPPMSDNPQKKVTRLKSDSSYTIEMRKGHSVNLRFSKQGIYHFYADSLNPIGFTVFVFTSGYPYVSTQMQMLMPLRYITTGSEFKKLINSKDKKKAVDEFWLNISSGEESAKNFISMYYNRVQDANILFPSDREGWMTDRGMIFIVYGPPERVFKNAGLETWVYGTSAHRTTMKFNFIKNDNPFTDNDYQLNRSPSYINSWSAAVEYWRR
jgi:GWxTD domain-containing protein